MAFRGMGFSLQDRARAEPGPAALVRPRNSGRASATSRSRFPLRRRLHRRPMTRHGNREHHVPSRRGGRQADSRYSATAPHTEHRPGSPLQFPPIEPRSQNHANVREPPSISNRPPADVLPGPIQLHCAAPALGDLTATKDEATAAAAALRAPPAHSKFPAVDGHQINSNSDAFTRAPLLTLPRASEATTT